MNISEIKFICGFLVATGALYLAYMDYVLE